MFNPYKNQSLKTTGGYVPIAVTVLLWLWSCQATSRDSRKSLYQEVVWHITTCKTTSRHFTLWFLFRLNKQDKTNVLVSFRGAGRQIYYHRIDSGYLFPAFMLS